MFHWYSVCFYALLQLAPGGVKSEYWPGATRSLSALALTSVIESWFYDHCNVYCYFILFTASGRPRLRSWA